MRFAKMRKFVLIVSRFSPAFAGAIKSAIGARKGKFKIPNIGRRAPEYREQSRRVRQGLKTAIFFVRWQSFLIFQKTVSTLIFPSFYLLFRMRNFSRLIPAPQSPARIFYGQRKASPRKASAAQTTIPHSPTAAHIPHAPTPTTHYACFVFSRALHPRGALFLLYKQPFFNNE